MISFVNLRDADVTPPRYVCLAVILGSYFVGIYLFSRLLYPLTDPGIYSSDLWNITVSEANDQDLVYRFADAL